MDDTRYMTKLEMIQFYTRSLGEICSELNTVINDCYIYHKESQPQIVEQSFFDEWDASINEWHFGLNGFPAGLLSGTKTYLIGPMQYAEGRSWREDISDFLREIKVTVFDPYKKPFINAPEEDEETNRFLQKEMEYELYDEVSEHMKKVRAFDLSMVDKADFIICYLDPKVPTFGTMEELSWAVRMKKPIFMVVASGKHNTPHWVMGMLPHKYIYNSFVEVKEVLADIHEDKKELDSDRWRLLKPELR
jgi:nucleoside 2-deoxyribosyltransferase